MRKIAVFRNAAGLCPFFEADRWEVHERKEAVWTLNREAHFARIDPGKIGQVRGRIEEILMLVIDCKVLAGGELGGVAYAMADRSGFQIFEIREVTPAILEEIWQEIINVDEENRDRALRATPKAPTETAIAGVYYLDLTTLQTEFPEVSSKKALMDFLGGTPFVELQVECRHTPPWLLRDPRFEVAEIKGDGGLTVVIRPKVCDQ